MLVRNGHRFGAIALGVMLATGLPCARGDDGDDSPKTVPGVPREVRVEVHRTESVQGKETKEDDGKDDGAEKNLKRRVVRGGKVVIIGPDGKKREFELPESSDFDGLRELPVEGGPQIEARLVRKPMIGVSLTNVPAEVGIHLGLEEGQGAMIGMVRDDSPAAKAGLSRFDIITHVNGEAVTDQQALQRRIEESSQEPLALIVIHAGQKKEITVTPAEMEAPNVQAILSNVPRDGRVKELLMELKMLEEQGDAAKAVTLLGSGLHLPADKESQVEIEKLSKEIQQLRQEFQELREMIVKFTKE